MSREDSSVQHRVSVEIMGDRYTIRGDAGPDYIAEVANMVDNRMRELAAATRNMSRTRLAVLTAINLADELLQAQRSGGTADDEIVRRTRHLVTLLDEGLIGDTYDDLPATEYDEESP